MKKIAAWMIRGGDQTRAALADQGDAIGELQTQVARLGQIVDEVHPLVSPTVEMPDQLRALVDDLGGRIAALTTRIDAIEVRLDALDESIGDVIETVAPADAE